MPHEGSHAAQLIKSEADLTEFEREQLSHLRIGSGSEFNVIITSAMALFNAEGWRERRREKIRSVRHKGETYEILWEQMPSPQGNKAACKFTVNVGGLNSGSLERVLGDDVPLTDAKTTMIYKYDTLLEKNSVECRYANNVFLSRTFYKAPIFAVAPREMRGYLSFCSLFDAGQQEKLRIRPRSVNGPFEKGQGGATPRKDLKVLAQCLIDYNTFNKTHAIEAPSLPSIEARKKYVLGSIYHYLLMGQEEVDGSLTITLIVDTDPAGSLPKKVVDMALSEQLEKLKRIVKLCEEQGPQENFIKTYENTREFAPFDK